MNDRRTLRLVIHGRVQGVWFRESMRREAEALGIDGWVRNRSDGTVEAVIHGPPAAVEAMTAWARRGPEAARVTSLESFEHPLLATTGFEKRPSD